VLLESSIKDELLNLFPEMGGDQKWYYIAFEVVNLYRIDLHAFIHYQDITGCYFTGRDTMEFCTHVGMDEEYTMLWILKFGDKLPDKIIREKNGTYALGYTTWNKL
jgi:hypothetical protein